MLCYLSMGRVLETYIKKLHNANTSNLIFSFSSLNTLCFFNANSRRFGVNGVYFPWSRGVYKGIKAVQRFCLTLFCFIFTEK